MRYSTQTLLRYELTCLTADAISLVLYTNESSLEVLDKLLLTLSQEAGLLLGEEIGTLVKSLERGRSVRHIVAVRVVYRGSEQVVVRLGLI